MLGPEHVRLDSTPVEVAATSFPELIAGEGQYLLVWDRFALRVSEATGQLLDGSPIRFGTAVPARPYQARGAYKSGICQLAWLDTAEVDILGSRIRASDGRAVDDPPRLLFGNSPNEADDWHTNWALNVQTLGDNVVVIQQARREFAAVEHPCCPADRGR